MSRAMKAKNGSKGRSGDSVVEIGAYVPKGLHRDRFTLAKFKLSIEMDKKL